jgi:hypothetical protein
MTVFFDGSRLRSDVYQLSLSRFKTTPKAELQKWFSEVRRLTELDDTDHAKAMLAWELTAIGKLHDGENYIPQKAEKYLLRLRQLPQKSVDLWSGRLSAFHSSDKTTTQIDSALSIILIDAFFSDEKFDPVKFGKIVGADRKP